MLFMNQVFFIVLLAAIIGGGVASLIFYFVNKNKPTRMSIMAEGIRLNAMDFAGMYESIYSISIGRHEGRGETFTAVTEQGGARSVSPWAQKQEDIFAAFTDAVRDSAQDNGYKRIISETFGDYTTWGRGSKKLNEKKRDKKYIRKASKLVRVFFKAGVLRAADTFVVADETTADRYDLAGERVLETDVTYEVLSPVWTLDNVVVNKGVIK